MLDSETVSKVRPMQKLGASVFDAGPTSGVMSLLQVR